MQLTTSTRSSLRLSATLLLTGQLLYIVVTHFHADGVANDHPAVFAEYAASGSWKAVHLGQFAAMSIMVAGLIALFFALDLETELAKWGARFGAASAVVALALYGGLQAADGVANKEVDVAWMSASGPEKAARFASAETIRWLEWGLRSYQNFALGLAFLLFAFGVLRTQWIPRTIAVFMGVSGIVYLMQGWIVGAEGFSSKESMAIIAAFVLDAVWMVWLVVIASRLTTTEVA